MHPPSLNDIRNAGEDFSHSLILGEAEIEKIENDTRGQSESERWFEERYKRITVSNFHSVYVRRSTSDPSALIKHYLAIIVPARKQRSLAWKRKRKQQLDI